MTETRRVVPSRTLSIVLGVLLVAGLVGLVVIVVAPVPTTTAHTEFYVLGPDGTAGNYSNATVDEPKAYLVGIENHEHERVTYRLVVEHEGDVLQERTPTVDDGATWQEEISLTFDSTGHQRVALLLYKDGASEPYRELYLNVNVSSEQS